MGTSATTSQAADGCLAGPHKRCYAPSRSPVSLGMPAVRTPLPSPARSPSHEHPPRHRGRPASRSGEPAHRRDGQRQADSARRRQRVITALRNAVSDGTEISVAGIARAAGVDRTFFYRHPSTGTAT